MIGKSVDVLGSTGSVGTQVLDVCRRSDVRVVMIAAHSNIGLLDEQIREFKPVYCAVGDSEKAKQLKDAVSDTDTVIISGYGEMCDAVYSIQCDIVYNAVSGKNGLLPTLSAVKSGKKLALAN